MGAETSVEASKESVDPTHPPGRATAPSAQTRSNAQAPSVAARILLRGEKSSGKTCLWLRLQGKDFEKSYSPSTLTATGSVNWILKNDEKKRKTQVQIIDIVDSNFERTSDAILREAAEEKDDNGTNASDAVDTVKAVAADKMYKNAQAVVFLINPLSDTSLTYVKEQVVNVPEDMDILILMTFRDLVREDTRKEDKEDASKNGEEGKKEEKEEKEETPKTPDPVAIEKKRIASEKKKMAAIKAREKARKAKERARIARAKAKAAKERMKRRALESGDNSDDEDEDEEEDEMESSEEEESDESDFEDNDDDDLDDSNIGSKEEKGKEKEKLPEQKIFRDEVLSFVSSLKESRESVTFIEISSLNCFGLKDVYKFLYLPFIRLQQRMLLSRLQLLSHEKERTTVEIESHQDDREAYKDFVDELATLQKKERDVSAITSKQMEIRRMQEAEQQRKLHIQPELNDQQRVQQHQQLQMLQVQLQQLQQQQHVQQQMEAEGQADGVQMMMQSENLGASGVGGNTRNQQYALQSAALQEDHEVQRLESNDSMDVDIITGKETIVRRSSSSREVPIPVAPSSGSPNSLKLHHYRGNATHTTPNSHTTSASAGGGHSGGSGSGYDDMSLTHNNNAPIGIGTTNSSYSGYSMSMQHQGDMDDVDLNDFDPTSLYGGSKKKSKGHKSDMLSDFLKSDSVDNNDDNRAKKDKKRSKNDRKYKKNRKDGDSSSDSESGYDNRKTVSTLKKKGSKDALVSTPKLAKPSNTSLKRLTSTPKKDTEKENEDVQEKTDKKEMEKEKKGGETEKKEKVGDVEEDGKNASSSQQDEAAVTGDDEKSVTVVAAVESEITSNDDVVKKEVETAITAAMKGIETESGGVSDDKSGTEDVADVAGSPSDGSGDRDQNVEDFLAESDGSEDLPMPTWFSQKHKSSADPAGDGDAKASTMPGEEDEEEALDVASIKPGVKKTIPQSSEVQKALALATAQFDNNQDSNDNDQGDNDDDVDNGKEEKDKKREKKDRKKKNKREKKKEREAV